MSQPISYLNALEIDTTDFLTDTETAYFSGIISSDSLNAKSYRLSEAVLRSIAEQANLNEGVPVFLNHKAFTSLPAGRSLSAKMTDNQVRTRFFIQRGLSDISSDDVIARIHAGTLRDLSIGFSGGEFICDVCDEPMSFQFGNRIDKKGHVLGQMIDDKQVTATVHGDIKLMEFSVVGIGADPDAKIISHTPLHLRHPYIKHIAEYHNLSDEAISQHVGNAAVNTGDDAGNTGGAAGNTGDDAGNTGGAAVNTGDDAGNTVNDVGNTEDAADNHVNAHEAPVNGAVNTGGAVVPRENDETPVKGASKLVLDSEKEKSKDKIGGSLIMASHKTVTEVLREENEELLQKNEALQQQLNEVISQEHYNALESELRETKATLDKRDATIRELENLSKVGEFALACERESVEKGYIAMRGTSIRGHEDPELISLRAELANEDDLRVLRDKAKSYWRQARQYPHRDGKRFAPTIGNTCSSTLVRLGQRANEL